MLSVHERQTALSRAYTPWISSTIHGALDRAAVIWRDRVFVITDERTWTYAEMTEWSRRLAAGLASRGIAAGDRVALLIANCPEFVALKYAVARLGAIAVPINVLNRRQEVAYVLGQSGAALLVAASGYRDADHLPMLVELSGDAELPALREIVVLPREGETVPPVFTPFAALDGVERDLPPVDAAACCDIIYTSGTTGPPKGVLLTHDMLTRTAFGSAYARAFEDGHRILFSLPMYHVYGYVEGLLAVPWVGGAIVPQSRFDPHATLAGVARHRATDMLLVPTMTLAVLETAASRTDDVSSLRFTLSSGGRSPTRVWQGLADLGVTEITTGYGMTETSGSTTVTRPDDPVGRLLGSNGRLRDVGPAADPAIGQQLVAYRVLDPETGADVAPSEPGELVARGLGVTRGYHDKPRETADAFTSDGWFRTGDLGCIDADGYLTLVGRLKESYRCGGEQVLPGEVEELLAAHPDVVQAHIVPVPDERMGEIGVAFVVAREGAVLSDAALLAHVAARLARFKVPRYLFVVDASDIPTTASGRARKFLLSEMAAVRIART